MTSQSLHWLRHIVVYTLENHSFDQLFGQFPGADGLTDGICLPAPEGPCVAPFPLSNCSLAQFTNPNHSWNAIHREWNRGAMNGFVRENGRSAMGYYPLSMIPGYQALAEKGLLLDRYFCSVLGPTLPNRLYLISGTSNGQKNDPGLFSSQTFSLPTLFDQLQEADIGWKYYVGSYCPTALGESLAKQLLFCPLFWFPRFMNTAALKSRIVAFNQFAQDVAADTLPPVSFLAPNLWTSSHPPIPISAGMTSAFKLYTLLAQSPLWNQTLLIINFDEAGGYYDHVPPPRVDAFGPGMRVPALLLSGHIRPGIVSGTFDHTSVLRLIEEHWGLSLLGTRTAKMPSLKEALL